MKIRKTILSIVLLMVFLCSCENKATTIPATTSASTIACETEVIVESIPTTTEPSAETIIVENCEDVFECLGKAGFDLVHTIIYDESNDPNGSGEHPYIQKASFVDGRIVENYSAESPLSGTIEFFANPDLAIERAMAISDSTYQVYAAQILSGSCLLRLGYDYSEDEIMNAAKSIDGEIYSNLNSSVYDSLDSMHGIGGYSFPISDSWEIKSESENLLYIYPNDSNGWITVKYNSGTKINANYLAYIQGDLRGANATFVSAEVMTVADNTEAVKFLATTKISGRDYYMLTVAFDTDHGHIGFVLIEPIAITDKIETYFNELITGIAHIEP